MDFPRHSSVSCTNTIFAPTDLTQTSESLSTFRNLPIEIQSDCDQAQLHSLRNAEERLTTEEIGTAPFKGTEWLQAQGVVEDGNVMDLLHWYIERRAHARFPTRLPSPDHTLVEPPLNPSAVATTNDTRVSEDHHTDIQLHHLQRMTEDLHRANTRIQAAIQESRTAARDVCTEAFLLQQKLEMEKAYQVSVSSTMARIVGAESMDGIEEQVGMSGDAGRLGGTGKKRRRASTPYHVVTADASQRVKRRRLDDPQTQDCTAPRTILNYETGDNECDDTYSDSNGTEKDFVDDPYPYLDSRGRTPYEEMQAWAWESDSTDEESTSDTSEHRANIARACIDDFDEDSSDSEYKPPDWDLEDIWEIKHQPDTVARRMNPLFLDNFGDELDDCHGFLSDANLSTDDPDHGYFDLAIVQRPTQGTIMRQKENFPPSLGQLLEYVHYEPSFFGASELDDEEQEAIKQSKIRQNKRALWYNVKVQLQYNLFTPLDIEQRLGDLLESNHHHFYFDDVEWRRLEDR